MHLSSIIPQKSLVTLICQQYWSSSISNDRSAALATKIEGVKGILMENIEKLMDREEKIGLLVEKTSEMQTQSFAFSTKSTELKRKLCWRNFRLYIVIAVLLMVRTPDLI
jgi:vesicle-associated membrane protein 7